MNIKKIIFKTPWIAWNILALAIELSITGGLFYISIYMATLMHFWWAKAFWGLGLLSLGLPLLFLVKAKSTIASEHEKREKTFKVKNLFFLSEKDIKAKILYEKLESEKMA